MNASSPPEQRQLHAAALERENGVHRKVKRGVVVDKMRLIAPCRFQDLWRMLAREHPVAAHFNSKFIIEP
jgi:hypothetical protein